MTTTASPEPGTAQRVATRTLDLTPSEVAVVGHLRGWCHSGTECALCLADTQLAVAREQIGRAQVAMHTAEAAATLARHETALWERDALNYKQRLDSIIGG